MSWLKIAVYFITGMACRAIARFDLPPTALWLLVFAAVMITATLIDGHEAGAGRRIVNEHLPWNVGIAAILATVVATGLLS